MKLPTLPTDEGKPNWGGLFWFLPCAYVFVEPYQRHAAWLEWILTSIGFLLFLGLYALGLVYWSRRQFLSAICVATTLLAIVFTAYRPAFGIFFAFVAAFAPFAVGGNVALSAVLILTTALLHYLEALVLHGGQHVIFALVFGLESIVVGAGTTFVARQQSAMARAHKVAERERIARDLHDILGHTLSGIVLKAELAGKLIERDPSRARAEMSDVESIARKALTEVREAIHGYYAGDLQTELEHACSLLELSGITVERHHEAIDLSSTQERVLVLALREAVTNVLRHARANRCWLQLRKVDSAYRLDIRDDGRGGVDERGFGIRGMRHRVEAIGGNISLTSREGTTLIITIPAASG